jgi:hypothetical protein
MNDNKCKKSQKIEPFGLYLDWMSIRCTLRLGTSPPIETLPINHTHDELQAIQDTKTEKVPI